MPLRRPIKLGVVEEGEQSFIEATYADGEKVRTPVDLSKKPKRRPRRPQTRVKFTPKIRVTE
jgi:hypothetical protein